ncbi:MAG: response regulator transcription factor [Synechococcales cyanobacterium CRU_2_2]|nr:response regulator transcription factor [Synechococcales cyanobacterium CRU_2_2]
MDILIVEDDFEIGQLVQLLLEREGFVCRWCRDGLAALDAVRSQPPDLIVLDLMIPGLDGLEVCARVRQQPGTKDPYILMVTAKGEEVDRIIGLSTGADDYLVKPFSPKELVARVRALLRRSLRQIESPSHTQSTPHFTLDLEQHKAYHHLRGDRDLRGDREELDLTTLEFKLLGTFLSYPGRVWSRSQLIERLWDGDFFGDERVIDTHVARLRKKIEPDPGKPTHIKTVIGAGYKFEDEANGS